MVDRLDLLGGKITVDANLPGAARSNPEVCGWCANLRASMAS